VQLSSGETESFVFVRLRLCDLLT